MGGTLSCAGDRRGQKGDDLAPYGTPVKAPEDDNGYTKKISITDISQPITNNNNVINGGVKTTKLEHKRGGSKQWSSFWRSMSLRRSKTPNKGFGSKSDMSDGGFGVHVSVNLPDVVDHSDVQPIVLATSPPSKPPRAYTSVSSDGVIQTDSSMPKSTCENFDSTGVVHPVPPNKPLMAFTAQQKCNSLPNNAVPSSVARRLASPTSGKIKIVSPELMRKSPSKPRKKSGEVTANDRHIFILQSASELLVQKLDPFMIIDKLADASLLDATALSIYRNPLDNRYICESIIQTVMDEDYKAFLTFCDILRSVADFTTIVAVLDAMRAVYDVIYVGCPETP